MSSNPAVISLLEQIRQHPGFTAMIEEFRGIQQPQLPRFRKDDAEKVETSRARWIYESGRLQMYEAIVAYLTAKGEPQ